MAPTRNQILEVPYLVIGSGVAGLMLALKLARSARVLLIAKGPLREGNSFYAQGGIASVLDHSDSFEEHVRDTMEAGAQLCHLDVVRLTVESGPLVIQELIDLGVRFTKREDKGDYHLSLEGGHSKRRVVHADDLTGRELVRALIAQVEAEPNIEVLENQMAVDLITSDKYASDFKSNRCLGAYVMDEVSREIYQVRSAKTFLCSGGHGKIYKYTSNPDVATGDGLAMAWRAGCRVANLEFMQFHPTCLFHPKARTFLISEAVRGEGAVLRDQSGRAFMEDYHPMGSLAPRDQVARAIDSELKKSGAEFVYLDAREFGEEKLKKHFPNIYEVCLQYGIDMAKDLIPVVPAAHYSCGGVVVDVDGRTNIEHLYAVGEVACTGLHGANRLASNSLLEALVFAKRIGDHVCSAPQPLIDETIEIPNWHEREAAPADDLVVVSHAWDEIRRLMWHYVGIVRSDSRLKRALSRLNVIREEIDSFYWEHQLNKSVIEVRNLAEVAALTIKCAMARKESRGIHFNIDYPETDDRFCRKDTVLR